MKADYRGAQTEQRKPVLPTRQQWEYRSHLMGRDADLTQFGAEGWQCYQVLDCGGDTAMFYFRRPV
ncbi:MAG: hypothetical protein ABFD89_09085 [Bryobacteraceae bacterium]